MFSEGMPKLVDTFAFAILSTLCFVVLVTYQILNGKVKKRKAITLFLVGETVFWASAIIVYHLKWADYHRGA